MTLDEAIKHCEEVSEHMEHFCGSAKFAIEYLQLAEWLRQVPRWISVKDRLPEADDIYLVYIVANNMSKNKSIITLYYTNLSKQFIYGSDDLFTVTHWMPLPQPPEKGCDTEC